MIVGGQTLWQTSKLGEASIGAAKGF